MTRILAMLIAATFVTALAGASIAEQADSAPPTEQVAPKDTPKDKAKKALTKEERLKLKEERAKEKARKKEERAKEKARKKEERARKKEERLKQKAERKNRRLACQEQAKSQNLRGQMRRDFVRKCMAKM